MNSPSQSPQHDTNGGLFTPVGTRRRFFQWVTGGIATIIGLGLAFPLAAYFVSPALNRRRESWVPVGKVDELPVGSPKILDYTMNVKDGWLETKTVKGVWVIRHPDNRVTVFSPICPHLGCGFRWNQQNGQFQCPCHGSVFDLNGKVLGGPAPRPLDVLPSKVENGELNVMYQEYKSGLSHQEEL